MNNLRYLDPVLIERLNLLQLSARRLAEGGAVGPHKSPRRGSSVEFRQHRFYVPGDDRRLIDWRVLARTDRHFVRQYEQETNLRCMIAMDQSGSMAYRGEGALSKSDYAMRLSAALAYLLLANSEQIGLATYSKTIDTWISPRGSNAQLGRIVDAMERSECGEAGGAVALRLISERLSRRTLVIVISDFFCEAGDFAKALAHMHHRRHEMIVLRVLHRDEMDFKFDSPIRLLGLEGEGGRWCDGPILGRIYRENFHRHEKQLAAICRRRGAELATFYTDEPIADVLSRFLRERLAQGRR